MTTQLDQIQFQRADGSTTRLADYAGKVVMIVNVASKCGLTPQYEGLQKLYEAYQEKGLMVLGFPSNQFAGQEPGSDSEIQEFCSTQYNVKFPVLKKIEVKGASKHPLFQSLTETIPTAKKQPGSGLEQKLRERGLIDGGPTDIMWNFEKFLVDRKGKVVARFAPDVPPNDPALISEIEKQLAAH